MLGFVWKLWDVMAASLVPKGLSFMQASARTVPLAECAAGGSAASHTKCQPWHFCDVRVLFVASPQAFPLDPTSFHAEWLTHCMSRDEVHGPLPALCSTLPVPVHGHLEPWLLPWLLLPASCLPGLVGALVHPGGTAAALEGPPCASIVLSGIALQPFQSSRSL